MKTFKEWLKLREYDTLQQPLSPQAKVAQANATAATAKAVADQVKKKPHATPQEIIKHNAGDVIQDAAKQSRSAHPNDQQPPAADLAASITPAAKQRMMRKK